MPSQLRSVLNCFSEQDTPRSLHQMAQDMALEPAVLHSMIDYWVRKGKLRAVTSQGEACTTCGIKGACPFVVTLPRYYELVQDDDAAVDSPCGCHGSCHSI